MPIVHNDVPYALVYYLTAETKGAYGMASKQKINASRALKHLMGRGILYQEDGGYHFYDPIFQHWIATRIIG